MLLRLALPDLNIIGGGTGGGAEGDLGGSEGDDIWKYYFQKSLKSCLCLTSNSLAQLPYFFLFDAYSDAQFVLGTY